jgi:acetyl esterase/lipase
MFDPKARCYRAIYPLFNRESLFMKTLCVGAFATVILALLACAPAGADAPAEDRLQLMDVFKIEYASDPQVSPDGKQVVNLQGEVQTLAENVGGTYTSRPYSSGSYSVGGDGVLAFTQTSPSHPADVAVRTKQDAKPRRLTTLNDSWLKEKVLGSVEEIWYESSHDKRKIQGWVVKPPHFDAKKKYPLILEIHGGPQMEYGPYFTAEIQLYAAAGYVVLYTNPRGSTGYGEAFTQLINGDYPGNDYDDLMSGVDDVLKLEYVDAQNLFVTGGSGGGILSAWIVGKTKRFRAAVVVKPIVNWYSAVLTSDGGVAWDVGHEFPRPPWQSAEEYLKRSPISLVGNVTTPTMLMTGEEDYRCPISEAEQFYAALKLRKVETALVRIPESSHIIVDRPSRLMAKVACILKWFELHRQTSAPAPGRTGQASGSTGRLPPQATALKTAWTNQATNEGAFDPFGRP